MNCKVISHSYSFFKGIKTVIILGQFDRNIFLSGSVRIVRRRRCLPRGRGVAGPRSRRGASVPGTVTYLLICLVHFYISTRHIRFDVDSWTYCTSSHAVDSCRVRSTCKRIFDYVTEHIVTVHVRVGRKKNTLKTL